MAHKRYRNLLLTGAAALVAAGAVGWLAGGTTPALSQYKVGHGVDVTVYESPT